jgi:hypothetical protein
MKKFFAQLRPMERRLAVGVLVILILVLNWLFIWPHFSDWSRLNTRMNNAQQNVKRYTTTIAETSKYESLVNGIEGKGQPIPQEDQSFNFLRTVRDQAAASGVGIVNSGRLSTKTNEFFSEQAQTIGVIANDAQLVDFLYKLGQGASMARVRELDMQPDQPHQHLNANVQIVASYQKKALTPAGGKAKPDATTTAKATPPAASAPATTAARTNSKPATVKSK